MSSHRIIQELLLKHINSMSSDWKTWIEELSLECIRRWALIGMHYKRALVGLCKSYKSYKSWNTLSVWSPIELHQKMTSHGITLSHKSSYWTALTVWALIGMHWQHELPLECTNIWALIRLYKSSYWNALTVRAPTEKHGHMSFY